jgi:RND family efflux transporter MFP subunit
METPPSSPPPATPVGGAGRPSRRALRIALLGLFGLAVLLVIGIVPRIQRHSELAEAVKAARSTALVVSVVRPTPGARTADFMLPGSIQAIQEAPIYSRVDGYLKRRLVDIGDRVQSGQVLAEIDTPDLDQQLAQARAAAAGSEASLAQARSGLQQARATLQHNHATAEYARTNLSRWRALRERNLVAQQDVDDRQIAFDSSQADVAAAEANVESLQSSVIAAQANVDASRANVQRLIELQAFQRVRAPFAGVITVRFVDAGALIGAGSSSTTTPMFRLAQTDDLRVFVNVPQTFMTAIVPGMRVQVLVREFPQKPFEGVVANASGALDTASRTLLTEVRVRNAESTLRPGMYADVKLHVERDHPPLLIPTSALIIQAAGPRVAVLGPDQRVRFQSVELGRDYGTTVEIVRGIEAGDQVVTSPPDGLNEDSVVRVAPAPAPRGKKS